MIGTIIEKKCLKKIYNLPENEIKLIQKALSKLVNLQYDNGLVVKRLKIKPNIALWEARIDESKRLIFTFGKHYLKTNEVSTCIQIWDYIGDHDDVIRKTKRSALNSDWWTNSEIIWSEYNIVDKIPQNPDVNLQELEENFPDERWDAFAVLGEEFQNKYIDPHDNLPWIFVSENPNDIFLQNQNFELLLSKHQYDVLKKNPPMVIHGSAGSGKTTLGLYFIQKLLKEYNECNVVYISKNEILVNDARETFLSMQKDNFGREVNFISFTDLLVETFCFDKKCIGSAKSYEYFSDFISKNIIKKYEPFRLWTEITANIKGRINKNISETLLSFDSYREISEKVSLYPVEEREFVYDLAKRYHEYLCDRNEFDWLDVIDKAFIKLNGSIKKKYDFFIIDEIQDFTQKEMYLLLNISRIGKGKGYILLGDFSQTIIPTQFRIQLINEIYYNCRWNIPEYIRLDLNYRNSTNIQSFANNLNLLIAHISKNGVEYLTGGTKSDFIPTLIENKFVMKYLNIPKPSFAIIVKDDEVKKSLKQHISHNFIWTIFESKGLEFDEVFVIDFLTDDFEHIYDSCLINPIESKRYYIESLLRQFYVCATRAKIKLYIVKSKENSFFDGKHFINSIVQEKVDLQEDQNFSKNDWLERASYYKTHRNWEAAITCFLQANETRWALLIKILMGQVSYLEFPNFKDEEEAQFVIEQKDLLPLQFVGKAYYYLQFYLDFVNLIPIEMIEEEQKEHLIEYFSKRHRVDIIKKLNPMFEFHEKKIKVKENKKVRVVENAVVKKKKDKNNNNVNNDSSVSNDYFIMPDFSDSYYGEVQRAIQLKRNGQFKAADLIYEELSNKFSKDQDLLFNWAKVKALLGEFDIAIRLMKESLEQSQKSKDHKKVIICKDHLKMLSMPNKNSKEFKNYLQALQGKMSRV